MYKHTDRQQILYENIIRQTIMLKHILILTNMQGYKYCPISTNMYADNNDDDDGITSNDDGNTNDRRDFCTYNYR